MTMLRKIGSSLFGENGLLSGMFKGLFGGGSGGGGGLGGFIAGLFGGGGAGGAAAVGMAKGGIMQYAAGGIATQPTYIVGEGKQHEAVVPLPDNRSIPVDLGKVVEIQTIQILQSIWLMEVQLQIQIWSTTRKSN